MSSKYQTFAMRCCWRNWWRCSGVFSFSRTSRRDKPAEWRQHAHRHLRLWCWSSRDEQLRRAQGRGGNCARSHARGPCSFSKGRSKSCGSMRSRWRCGTQTAKPRFAYFAGWRAPQYKQQHNKKDAQFREKYQESGCTKNSGEMTA